MNLLDKYIIQKYLTTFLFILGMVIVIVVVVDINEKLDEFLDKKPPIKAIIFDYYFNFIPYFGSLLSPICIFLTVIFFTSSMAQRSELVPILSGGVSFYRVLLPYLVTSIFLAGVSFYLKAYLVPLASEQQIEFEYRHNFKKRRVHKNKDVHKKVAEDTFVYLNYYNEKRQEITGFQLDKSTKSDFVSRIKAEKASWVDSMGIWRLNKVWIRDFKGKKSTLHYVPTLDTTILLTPDDIFIKENKAATMTLPALNNYIALEEMRGSDILEELYLEKYRRYADPVAIIILTLIGFAMASRKSRGGIALQIGIGLLICFIYITMLFAGQAIVGDSFSPAMAVWLPNMIFFPIALLLLRLAPK